MGKGTFYVTTSIPYVNAHPHLGHALEFVQADVLARHRRRRGDRVRLLSGTDDNALKNVQAAREAGVPVREFVDRNADRFAGLAGALELSFDDFIRTSVDARHTPAVERLWRACESSGDLYRRTYEGLYCVGCEQFYDPAELEGGLCPEHKVAPESVSEENWFFRLGLYESRLLDLIESGELRIDPVGRRNEVLSFIRGGLQDVSVSRPSERAEGWGITVPGDHGQVVYVWFDALANYISSLGYASGDDEYEEWWCGAGERVHVIGKGILRFHAVLWPAFLLSAGETLPTTIFVHDYLTVNGQKLSKSSGNAQDPTALVEHYGVDAVRWWLLRDVPRVGDADFTEERLVRRYNTDLAGGIGNLLARVTALAGRSAPTSQDGEEAEALRAACCALPGEIDRALGSFDLRRATGAILDVVAEANRLLERTRPWERAPDDEVAAAVVGEVLACTRLIARELEPFLPSASARLLNRLDGHASSPPFPRLELSGASNQASGRA